MMRQENVTHLIIRSFVHSYRSKRHRDPDSDENLHLFAIRTSTRREWKRSE